MCVFVAAWRAELLWALLSKETLIAGIIVLNVCKCKIPLFISVVLGSEYFAEKFLIDLLFKRMSFVFS